MNLSSPLRFSILGDSISTFEGYSPRFDAYYMPVHAISTQVATVKDTWWMQVIESYQGILVSNDSYAGSSVSRGGYQAANTPWRLARLAQKDFTPDYILIYAGLNDITSYITPEDFEENYGSMLQHLVQLYPAAKICCGTLCRGEPRNRNIPLFVDFDQFTPLSEYNEAIRRAIATENCYLVDLAATNTRYSSLDGVHPDGEGMRQLAQLWISHLKD